MSVSRVEGISVYQRLSGKDQPKRQPRDEGDRAAGDEAGSHGGEPHDEVSLRGVPVDAMAPQAREAVFQLLSEVERLRGELSKAQAHIRALEALVLHDPLVGTLNRRGFEQELERAISYAARHDVPIGLIYLDINAFKGVNDTHGHEAGDQVLTALAEFLRANLRNSDVVGRVGGDEFAAILWNAPPNEVEAKAQTLSALVTARPVAAGGTGLAISIAAGATSLVAGDTAGEAMARADAAMYEHKRRAQGAASPGDADE